MTVSSTTSKVSYTGNGSTTAFAVPFYFLAAADLQVILRSGTTETVQVLTTNYTVSGAGNEAGGTVTMLVAPAAAVTVTIRRNIAATQETDLLPNDRLPAESLETALDKATMLAQQLGEESARSIKFPASDAVMSAQLPASSARAGKYLGFDASGLPVVADGPATPYSAVDVSYLASGSGATLRSVATKLQDAVSVKDFGAVGNGVANDTAAIQAAATSLTQGQILYFPAGQYLIGQIIFDGKSNIGVSAYGARFTLSGNNAGFLVKGVCNNIYVAGGSITGDGVNRDASPSTAQIGWTFGNEAGAHVQNVFVQDVIVDAANNGFKFALGTGGSSGNANYVKVQRCQAKDIVGVVGGMGYGFQFTQAPNSVISDSVAINCQRHGIYFAEGRNYAATNCVVRDHRSTVFNASYRAAFSISRSRNVAVSNCVFDNCYDGTIEVDVDTQGTAPDNVSIGTAITNCTFLNSALADIRIGTVPATDGTVYDVTITNCMMVRNAANAISSIVIEGGERIKITDNFIDGSAAAAGIRAISLNATSGAIYTNDVEIVRNTINSAGYGVQIESALKTGTTRVRVLDNKITATTAELEFVGGEDATTNDNLIYNRTNGKNANRAYTSSGSTITIPVGGLDVLTLNASGATTVSNFSGGTEGQELLCYFTNGNTTLLNTNFFTAGALNFVGSQYDTITFVYLGGFWREKCRSLN